MAWIRPAYRRNSKYDKTEKEKAIRHRRSMTEIRFVVRGRAVPQGSTRAFAIKQKGTGHYRAVTTNQRPDLTAWRNLVASEAQRAMTISDALEPPHMRALLGGALKLEVHFTFERPKSRKKNELHVITKPDLDKLIRAIMDALTGIVWHDDSQVFIVVASKTYARYAACSIIVTQATNPENDLVSDGSNDI